MAVVARMQAERKAGNQASRLRLSDGARASASRLWKESFMAARVICTCGIRMVVGMDSGDVADVVTATKHL